MKAKRVFSMLLVITIIVSLFSGCSPKTQDQVGVVNELEKEKAISYNIGGDPSTIDPAKTSTTNEIAAVIQMFEGLVRLDGDGKAVPGTAESWEINDDATVFTFKLRDSKFSNGHTITSNDFIYSWKRALDPRTESVYAFLLWYIKGGEALNSVDMSAADADIKIKEAMSNIGLEAIDDKTLRVNLESSVPFFLSIVALPAFYPVDKEIVENNEAWADNAENYISNGPFKLTNWEHGQKLSLVKNDQYWDKDNIKLDKLDLFIIEQGSTEVTMWETGQLDATFGWGIPISEVQRLDKEGKIKYTPLIQNRYVMLNNNKPPFNDPRIRKAISLTLDRKAIAENIMKGAVPLYAYVPKGLSDADPTKDFREVGGDLIKEDIQEAKRLLAEAGYPDGKDFPGFEIVYTTDEKSKAIVEAMVEMWSKNLNIKNITVKNVEGKIRSQLRRSGDFQATTHGWTGDYLDPLTFLQIFMSDNAQNNGKYSNPEYDKLVKLAETTVDPEIRCKAMHEAEEILLNDAGCIPFSTEKNPYTENPKLKGIVRNALGQIDFKWAYLED